MNGSRCHTVFLVDYENSAQRFITSVTEQPDGVDVYVFFNPNVKENWPVIKTWPSWVKKKGDLVKQELNTGGSKNATDRALINFAEEHLRGNRPDHLCIVYGMDKIYNRSAKDWGTTFSVDVRHINALVDKTLDKLYVDEECPFCPRQVLQGRTMKTKESGGMGPLAYWLVCLLQDA